MNIGKLGYISIYIPSTGGKQTYFVNKREYKLEMLEIMPNGKYTPSFDGRIL